MCKGCQCRLAKNVGGTGSLWVHCGCTSQAPSLSLCPFIFATSAYVYYWHSLAFMQLNVHRIFPCSRTLKNWLTFKHVCGCCVRGTVCTKVTEINKRWPGMKASKGVRSDNNDAGEVEAEWGNTSGVLRGEERCGNRQTGSNWGMFQRLGKRDPWCKCCMWADIRWTLLCKGCHHANASCTKTVGDTRKVEAEWGNTSRVVLRGEKRYVWIDRLGIIGVFLGKGGQDANAGIESLKLTLGVLWCVKGVSAGCTRTVGG
jgi:hypothetical protein